MADNELVVKLTAQFEGFKQDIEKAAGSWDGFLKTVGGGGNIFLGATAAIAAAGAAVFALAKTTANAGDKLNDISEKTGVSVEKLSLLKFAAEQSNTNIEALAGGLKFLGKSMMDAQDKNSAAADTFKALQIETKNLDGSLRPMDDVLLDVADRFQDLTDPALKSTVAMQLFGKSGVDLVPFLNQGAKGSRRSTPKEKHSAWR